MGYSSSMGGLEILQVADAVAREKNINRNAVLEAMEQSVQVAGRRKYGHKHNIRAEIDRKTGEIRLFRMYEVVENCENLTTEISLEDALQKNPDIKFGEFISELLPPIDLGRVAASAAKQVIVQVVKEAERDRQYEDFKDRVGEIMNGVVKRIENGDIIIEIGRDEAVLKKDAVIPGEAFRPNERIRVYVENVKKVSKGPQIFLSRVSENFLAKLFALEVPEIYDNIIKIKAVARDPGSKAKIAVFSGDSSVDAIGSCVGVRGSRVQAVTAELRGEKIDIIQWSADPATYVVNALSPAQASKVVIDEEKNRIEVVVPADQLSIAIGRKGQNIRLASRIVGWAIDVMSEDEESKRRAEEFITVTQLFMESLNIEEVMAQLLAAEGFSSVQEVAYVPLSDLTSIDGFDEDLAEALQIRAREYAEAETKLIQEKLKTLGVDIALQELLEFSPGDMVKLGESGIKKIEDLGAVTVREFRGILPNSGLAQEQIAEIIKYAANHKE